MKAFMTCLAAVTWVSLVIWVMDTDRRQVQADDKREALHREIQESLSRG